MDNTITINDKLEIPYSELSFKFARSGGHGGQNVNKVETKVELLFDVGKSPSLSDAQRRQLMNRLQSRIDADGILRIVEQDSRSQWRNRVKAMDRFRELMSTALKPVKRRIATKIPRQDREKRLEAKKRRSRLKQLRRDIE
jgi:ribosome-associated protein